MSVCRLVGWSVVASVCNNFFKGPRLGSYTSILLSELWFELSSCSNGFLTSLMPNFSAMSLHARFASRRDSEPDCRQKYAIYLKFCTPRPASLDTILCNEFQYNKSNIFDILHTKAASSETFLGRKWNFSITKAIHLIFYTPMPASWDTFLGVGDKRDGKVRKLEA